MNPLDIPKWGKAKKKEPEIIGRNISLGPRSEAVVVDKEAAQHITIEVRSIRGAHPGTYKVAYQRGMSLGDYLRRLRLRRLACYNAVYDLSSKSKGRLRMTYVPVEGSHIVIGSGSLGVSTKYQRSSVDAQRVAFRMGGGKQVVEGKL